MPSERYVSLTVVGVKITVVHAEVPTDQKQPITIVSDATWTVQDGERAPALDVLYKRCASYLAEHKAERVVIKASALSTGGTKLALLESAECRGVVLAASASLGKPVYVLSKALISKTYGKKKVDEYIRDEQFWVDHTIGAKLRKSSREAAMLIVAQRNR